MLREGAGGVMRSPYSGKTLDELKVENPKLLAVTEEGIEKVIRAYEDSLVTEPEAITEEQWDYALNVLPPCRWERIGEMTEVFHISERITGNLVDWYGHTGADYCHFVDHADVTVEHLWKKVNGFALKCIEKRCEA